MYRKIICMFLAFVIVFTSLCGCHNSYESSKEKFSDINIEAIDEYINSSSIKIDDGVYQEFRCLGDIPRLYEVVSTYTAYQILTDLGYEINENDNDKRYIESIFSQYEDGLINSDFEEYVLNSALLANLLGRELSEYSINTLNSLIASLQAEDGSFVSTIGRVTSYNQSNPKYPDLATTNTVLNLTRAYDLAYDKEKLISLLENAVENWDKSKDSQNILDILAYASVYVKALDTFELNIEAETKSVLEDLLSFAEDNIILYDAYIFFWSNMIDVALYLNRDTSKYLDMFEYYWCGDGYAIFPVYSDNKSFNNENSENSSATSSVVASYNKCGINIKNDIKEAIIYSINEKKAYDGAYLLDYSTNYNSNTEQSSNYIIRILYEIGTVERHRDDIINHLETRKTHPVYSDMIPRMELLAFGSAILCGYDIDDEELMKVLKEVLDEADWSIEDYPDDRPMELYSLCQFFEYQHLGDIVYSDSIKERLITLAERYGTTEDKSVSGYTALLFKYLVYNCFGMETKEIANDLIKIYNDMYRSNKRLAIYYASKLCSLLMLEPEYKSKVNYKEEVLNEIANNKYYDFLYKLPGTEKGTLVESTEMCVRIIKYFGE